MRVATSVATGAVMVILAEDLWYVLASDGAHGDRAFGHDRRLLLLLGLGLLAAVMWSMLLLLALLLLLG